MIYRCHLFTISKNQEGYKTIFCIFLCWMLIGGCHKETPKSPKTTNAELYVRYLADEMKLTAECTFLEKSGETLTKKTFDNVTFHNQLMRPRKISEQQMRYQVNIKRQILEKDYELKYWNKDEEQPASIKIAMPTIDSFQISKTMKSEGELRIFGNSLLKNEEIILLFTNEAQESKALNYAISIWKAQFSSTKNSYPRYLLERIKFTLSEQKLRKLKAPERYWNFTQQLLILRYFNKKLFKNRV